jgi:hypothetical protein
MGFDELTEAVIPIPGASGVIQQTVAKWVETIG